MRVDKFFSKNRFPPTSPKTYLKHSSRLLLSSENEPFKEGRKTDHFWKKLSIYPRFHWSNSRLDSYVSRIYKIMQKMGKFSFYSLVFKGISQKSLFSFFSTFFSEKKRYSLPSQCLTKCLKMFQKNSFFSSFFCKNNISAPYKSILLYSLSTFSAQDLAKGRG